MRDIDTDIVNFLKTRKPYSYAHLIKFERPIIAPQEFDASDREYVYLTDGSIDLHFNDPRTDSSPTNLATKYRANRVLQVPGIQEYSKARATSIDLKLDGAAIGTTLADSTTVTSTGADTRNIQFSYAIYNKGIVPGDKILLSLDATDVKVLVTGFPSDNVMSVKVLKDPIPVGTFSTYIELQSEELVSILQDKFSDEYATFINREVFIYKVYFDEETKERVGSPYLLYKGIIQDVSLEDQDNSIIVNWTLNSHWGDFSEVRGRMTTDEFHRGLDERGMPQPEVTIKPIYATDRGFIHADTAVHLEAIYTVQVEKQDVKYKKGFFGIGAKVKVKKYMAPEDRQTELDFQLQSKTLDVVYGVRPVEGFPIFADTLKNDSNEVFVGYAFCEGEVGGIYDLIIQDKSLICNNKADFDARSQQTDENNIDVVCYGRADKGDILNGVTSTTTSTYNFYNTDYVEYENFQANSFLVNANGYSQPLSVSSGSVGVLHENSIRLTAPINMTLDFYSGRTSQRAAPNLVQQAQAGNFKVQNDYWTGNKMDYWGPNHRLCDTAYAVVHYTIGENETTIPTVKTILKGKFINCYNYDYTYQQYEKASGESAANFSIGDSVTVHDSAGTQIGTNRIIDKFSIRNNSGLLETRFKLETQPPLGYTQGIPSITKFSIRKGGNIWTMTTYNYIEQSGTVAENQAETVTSVNPTTAVVTFPSTQTIIPATPVIDKSGYYHEVGFRWEGGMTHAF